MFITVQDTQEQHFAIALLRCYQAAQMKCVTQSESTYQLCDAAHLSHVVQGVFCGFAQHDEAGGHNAKGPERFHGRIHVTLAI